MKESTKKMATVQYIKKRKDPVGKENRKQMKDSLKSYNMYTGGGDDCA